MKRIILIAIVLLVSTICYSQQRVGDFNKINVRQLLHSNGMYLIYPDADTVIQFRYDNMADPDSPLDGVNLRTLQAFSDTSKTEATDSLFLEFANEWLAKGDTIVEDDSMAYFRYPIEDCDWCIQIKHPKDNTWSPTICRESGLSNLFISENAERIYRIENNGVDRIGFMRDDQPASMFPKNPDFSLMAKQNGKYNFFPNAILGENYTAYGYGAGEVIGTDTIIKFGSYQNPNTGEFEIIDTAYYYPKYGAQNFDNVVLVGHNSRPTANDQIVVGDTSMNELRTYGTIKAPNYATKKAVGVGYDTLFTKHLVINVKDTAKFAKRAGDSIYWELLPIDSIYFANIEKWGKKNDTILFDFNDADFDPINEKDTFYFSNVIGNNLKGDGDTVNIYFPYLDGIDPQMQANERDVLIYDYDEGYWTSGVDGDIDSTNELDSLQINGVWYYNGGSLTTPNDTSLWEHTDGYDYIYGMHSKYGWIGVGGNSQESAAIKGYGNSAYKHSIWGYATGDVSSIRGEYAGTSSSAAGVWGTGLQGYGVMGESQLNYAGVFGAGLGVVIDTYNNIGTNALTIEDEHNIIYYGGISKIGVLNFPRGNLDSLKVGSTGQTITRTGTMATKDFWSGTQSEYDALTPDANTIYFINQGYGLLGLLILLLTFLGSNAQNWSAVKVGSTDIVKIYQGGDVIWEKPTEDWTYEGVMTVGSLFLDYVGYHYNDGFVQGALIPKIKNESLTEDINYGEGELGVITTDSEGVYFSVVGDCIMQINSEKYVLTNRGDQSIWTLNLGANPFPAVGETCEIKLKYTLAPQPETVTIGGEE